MRLIDADALAEVLGIEEDCQDCQYKNGVFCKKSSDFVDACEAIYDAPTIEAEWIPVSERLPDIKEGYCSETCLAYTDTDAYCFTYLEANIFGRVGWNCERDDDYHDPIGEVLAWMPLPKPYKAGDSE